MTASKIVLNAASGVGGAGLDVDEVFSTNLYTGTNAALTVNTGLDQNTEGGMLWVKSRSTDSTYHGIWDTERTNGYYLGTNSTANQGNITAASGTNPFLRDGSFRWNSGHGWFNQSGEYVAWAFRKAPKFFDVVTYTGNGVAGREIAHNLGCEVGTIIVKCLTTGYAWAVYHRSLGNTQGLNLNTTNAAFNASYYWNNTSPTSTDFTLSGNANVNGSDGDTYVAYLFAHNDGDGEFGPDGDADIIKCGSYTGDGGAGTTEVNLGFEPQWILVKASSAADNWFIIDNMRGWATHNNTANDAYLLPNAANAESTGGFLDITSTGFKTTLYSNVNVSGREYIYTAIRRGPLAPPEAATEVFDVSVTDYSANQTIAANIDVTDTFMVGRQPTSNNSNGLFLFSRLTGNKRLRTDQTFTENAELGLSGFDTMNGVVAGSSDSGQNVWNSGPFIKYFMKRAPNYMDVVAYTGNYTAGHNISHNLGVAPEMMWVKKRNAASFWRCYHKDLGNTKALALNDNGIAGTSTYWSNTTPTESVFTVGIDGGTNSIGDTFIAYLFASLDGISKVGSVTHSGTTNVDCGFSSGARFVLLKRTDATSDWYFWDTTRGIVSGNDPYLTLNGSNQPEITNTDYIDPLSSGFTITSSLTAGDYIFYAIA